MASQMVVRRMKRELHLLSHGGAAPGISAWPRDNGEDGGPRLDVLDAEINGASDTPYEGGIFRLEIHLPPEYPLKPPRVRFVTPIYHPNIDSQGRICLDSLSMPPKGAWKPSLNISTLLTTIQALMSSPNPDDGLMVEITDEFRRNPALFKKKAKDATVKHATPNNDAPVPGESNDSKAETEAEAEAEADAKAGKEIGTNGDKEQNHVEDEELSSISPVPASAMTDSNKLKQMTKTEQYASGSSQKSSGSTTPRLKKERGAQQPSSAVLNASGKRVPNAEVVVSESDEDVVEVVPSVSKNTNLKDAWPAWDDDEIQPERPSRMSRLKKRPRHHR